MSEAWIEKYALGSVLRERGVHVGESCSPEWMLLTWLLHPRHSLL